MSILKFKDFYPEIKENAFVAENAVVIGEVEIKEGASIWYNCVLRGDTDKIEIGKHSNIQDGTLIHCDPGIPTIVGDYVSVGHGAILHACKINDKVLIGMGAIVLDEAEIGSGVIVAAGAVVTPRTKVPENTIVAGTPARVIKHLDPKEQEERVAHALRYEDLSDIYLKRNK